MHITRYLPIRVCSGKKSSIQYGSLQEIYTCHMLQAFFKTFGDYAVLSRKNGVCFSWEQQENYGDYQEKNRGELHDLLEQQSRDPRYNQFTYIYWNHRPITHNSFVQLLREAGFNVIEARTLNEVHEYIRESEHRSIPNTIQI